MGIDTQIGQTADMVTHVDPKDPKGVNDVVTWMVAVAKQHALDESQRNANEVIRDQMKNKFLFVGDAVETTKGGYKPPGTIAQKACKFMGRAKNAEQSATCNIKKRKSHGLQPKKVTCQLPTSKHRTPVVHPSKKGGNCP